MSRIDRRLGASMIGLLAGCSAAPHDELLSRIDLGVDQAVIVGSMTSMDLVSRSDDAALDGSSGSLSLLKASSRKAHAFAGSFDLPLALSLLNNGGPSIEPRAIGAGHLVVFQFNGPISSAGTPTALNAGLGGLPVGTATASFAGNEVLVTLAGVPDVRQVIVGITGVNGSVNAQVSVGFLQGDVDGSRTVNDGDVSLVSSASAQIVDANNFMRDVNVSGTLTTADVATVSGLKGNALP